MVQGQISETYSSPALRWALLLEDLPGSDYDFALSRGGPLGIPEEFGGDGQFCVATITYPSATGRAATVAWKPVPARGSPDDWNVLCTKTLGRALKRAGYPDSLPDLKALVLWRHRNAEVAAIGNGAAPARALPAPAVEPDPLEAPRPPQAYDDDSAPATGDDAYDPHDPTRPFVDVEALPEPDPAWLARLEALSVSSREMAGRYALDHDLDLARPDKVMVAYVASREKADAKTARDAQDAAAEGRP